jgi:hypothetical protein
MLMELGAKRIDLVDSGEEVFGHGLRNIHSFVQAFDELKGRVGMVAGDKYRIGGGARIVESAETGKTVVVPCNMMTSEYFRRLPAGSHLNLVYTDPPFAIDGSGYEATDEGAVDWIVENVTAPMEENQITADYLCVRSRVAPEKFNRLFKQRFPRMEYVAGEACVPYRLQVNQRDVAEGHQTVGVFYGIVFATNSVRVGMYTNSMLWDDLVNQGKGVLVDKKKYISPRFPEYSAGVCDLPDEESGDTPGGDLVMVQRTKAIKRRGHWGGRHHMNTDAFSRFV